LKISRIVLPMLFAAPVAFIGMALPVKAPAGELVKFAVVDGHSIPKSLTGKPGDPVKGRAVVINRKQGNCLACHDMPIPEQPYHGKIGPDLTGVGSRLTEGELRLRIVNPKYANPHTIMPAFYRTEGLYRVAKKFQGKPMLTAEQVEDVVAYLKTLKE
jgi:sulfur-oxidizing protein SoxX